MNKPTERDEFVVWFNKYLYDPNIGEVENRIKCNAAWAGWQARTPPVIDSADEFLAKRLGRVAKLADVPMPDNMDYKQIAECAGAILGQIARNLEIAQKENKKLRVKRVEILAAIDNLSTRSVTYGWASNIKNLGDARRARKHLINLVNKITGGGKDE